jgi:putative membrane protein
LDTARASSRGRASPEGSRVPAACLTVFLVAFVVCAIRPRYPADWLLENLLTFVAVPAIVIGYLRGRRLSDQAYVQVTCFLLLHTVGSHYTYSEVPVGNWVRDTFGLARNHYDRVVHFSFGLLMVRPLRELTVGEPRAIGSLALAYLGVASVAAWSTAYEIIEWLTAATVDPEAGTAFLGTQGDVWDAQKDMALAMGGATIAAVIDRWQLRRGRRRRGAERF